MKTIAFAALVSCSFFAHAGVTYYVDSNRPDDKGTGESPSQAKRTIQAAVDCAKDGDTVVVMPGHYREGGKTTPDGIFSRVSVTNNITIKSSAGKGETFVHGLKAEQTSKLDTKAAGLGPQAERCFYVASSAKSVRIEGLTILDGATDCVKDGTSWQLDRNRGGGILGLGGVTLVDSVVSNCIATYGGAMYKGKAARTYFTDNYSLHGGSAGYEVTLYHSIVTRSTGGVTFHTSKLYNCTLVENENTYAGSQWVTLKFVNSVILHNIKTYAVPFTQFQNCVIDDAVKYYAGANSDSGIADLSTSKSLDMTSAENLFQFLAPALDDYRPLKGSALDGGGSADGLEEIPDEFREFDFYGNAFDPSAGVNVGAVQTLVEPVTGAIVFAGEWNSSTKANCAINGKERMIGALYAFATSFPRQICLDCVLPTGEGYVFWGFSASGADTLTRFPQLDGKTWVLPPPKGQVLTLSADAVKTAYWVDDDEVEGTRNGTEDAPFETIQEAVDTIQPNTKAVIFVKGGVYDKGGAVNFNVTNRIYLGGKWIRVVAVDGPDSTKIVGSKDANGDYGIGAGAVRCIGFGGSGDGALKQAVCGFTLELGRTVAGELGGAARGWGQGARLIDCVITNCCATQGAAAYGVDLERCRIVDCTATNRGIIAAGRVSSSVILNSHKGNNTAYVFETSCKAYHCTIVQENKSADVIHLYLDSSSKHKHINNVVKSVYGIANYPSKFVGTIAWDWSWLADGHPDMTLKDPMLVKSADGDYAVSAFSPAVGHGDVDDEEYYKYATTDIHGNPLRLAENGKPTSGAYQNPVPGVFVTTASSGHLSGDGISPCGSFYVHEGETLSLTATDIDRRNLAGFVVGDKLVEGVTTYDFTPPAGLVSTAQVAIAAKYVPYWYVDPKGDDANNGWSWQTPKQSLENVMALAVSNDTVYAAAGVYTNGTMLQTRPLYSGVPELRARVVVPSFVTLESRDGAEKTFIVGEAAPGENANEYGCGTGAVRCVAMMPHARLKGFTVTGGRCHYDINSNDDNNRGAGIISDRFTGLVSDCIISNNVAHDAGGALFGRYARCQFLENTATRVCSAARNMVAWGCYFDRNRGPYAVTYWQKLVGCTIGPDNVTLTGTPAPLGTSPVTMDKWSTPEVVGTLICTPTLHSGAELALTNCAFASEWLANLPAGVVTNDTCVIVPFEKLATERGVPLIGANAAIDRADGNWWDEEYCGASDTYGAQRVYNGAMDIGCFEADWRGVYARSLGRNVTVSAADPSVVKSLDGGVFLADGELALEFALRNGSGNARTFKASVTGTGTLSVICNGINIASLVSADGERIFSLPHSDTPDSLVFAYAAQAGDTGGAVLSSFKSNMGSAIVVR